MSDMEPRNADRPALAPALRLAVLTAAALGGAAVLYVIGASVFKPAADYRTAKGPAGVSMMLAGEAQAAVPDPALHVIPPLAPKGQGGPAPSVAFLDASGKPVRVSDFKGKVVVLNLWATWCAPCRKEMPELAALQAKLAGRPVKVVALSVDKASAAERAKAFIAQNAPLTFYQDPSYAFPNALRPPVMGFPTTILYDKSGRARATIASDVDWGGERVRKVLAQLAAE